jgi:hypothetical protein
MALKGYCLTKSLFFFIRKIIHNEKLECVWLSWKCSWSIKRVQIIDDHVIRSNNQQETIIYQ